MNDARARWRMLALGGFAQASTAALNLGLPALGPSLIAHYRLSLGGLGQVLSCTAVGMTFTLLAWGVLSDRVGERRVMSLGLVAGALGLVLAAAGPGRPALMAGLVVAGMGSASVNAASGRVVLGWFRREERGLAMGVRQAAVPVGGALGAAGLPAAAALGGVAAALWGLIALYLAAAASVATGLRDERPALEDAGEGRLVAGGSGGALPGGAVGAGAGALAERPPLKNPRVWRLSVASGLLVMIQVSLFAYFVVFLHSERGLGVGAAAGTLVGLQLAGAATRVALGRLSDRRGDRIGMLRLVALALGLAVVLLGLVAFGPIGLLLPLLFVAALLSLSPNGLAFTAAGEAAGLARSGAALGLQNSVVTVSAALAPAAFAPLVSGTSWGLAFGLLALPAAAAALLVGRRG